MKKGRRSFERAKNDGGDIESLSGASESNNEMEEKSFRSATGDIYKRNG